MAPDQDDIEPRYHTREEALFIAEVEALRNLTAQAASISYVGHLAELNDYCFCEFVREEVGWVKTVRSLTPEERMPGEEIPHSLIVELARSGNMISAVRLYRSKHQIGLKEAVDAVSAIRYGRDA